MARKNDDLLIEDDLTAAFMLDDDQASTNTPATPAPATDDNWEEEADDLMGHAVRNCIFIVVRFMF